MGIIARMDFLKLMGKGKRCWKHVKHVEQIIAFQTLFEKNRREAGDRLLIPEILHVVWLGDRPYPETSKRYLEGWKRMHPTWQVHVWTEENIALGEYRDLYERSNNCS